jgi:hypothetical protein
MFYCLIFVKPFVNSVSAYGDCDDHAELTLPLAFQDNTVINVLQLMSSTFYFRLLSLRSL